MARTNRRTRSQRRSFDRVRNNGNRSYEADGDVGGRSVRLSTLLCVARSAGQGCNREQDFFPIDSFRMVFFEEDLVIAQLTKSILGQVRNREPLNMLALEDVSLLVSTHLLQHYGTGKGVLRAQPRLESWQKIRAEEMLRTHLEGNLRIAGLASASQLSPSHFSRCFRQSFGTSVHQWLIRLRIDIARDLLRAPELSLAEVGFRSGFCDQAAFTRAFTKLEGITPFRWRKLNGDGTVATDHLFPGELRLR